MSTATKGIGGLVIGLAFTGLFIFGVAWVASRGWNSGQK